MADLLHTDTIHQLEVALLGLPAANVIDLLASGWEQTGPVLMATQPHPQTYTSIPPAPAPTVAPVFSISSQVTIASTPSDEKLPTTESQDVPTESQTVPVVIPKCCHLILTLVISSDSLLPSTSSPSSDLPPKLVS